MVEVGVEFESFEASSWASRDGKAVVLFVHLTSTFAKKFHGFAQTVGLLDAELTDTVKLGGSIGTARQNREDGDIVFVQTTVYKHFAERLRKCQNFKGITWINCEVHGWHKKDGTWWCRTATIRRGQGNWKIIPNGNL